MHTPLSCDSSCGDELLFCFGDYEFVEVEEFGVVIIRSIIHI